jgi:hypothetical protein
VFNFQFPRSKKGIYFWFLTFSGFMLFVSLLALLGAAGDLSSTASDLKNLKVEMPNLEDYANTQPIDFRINGNANQRRLKPSDIPKLAKDAIIPVRLDDAVNRAFEYFSEFENKRSAPILTITLPVVEAVEQGSPADLAGVKSGDSILFINSVKIESVLGAYLAFNEKPSSEVPLKVLRNKKDTISLILKNPNRTQINGSNSGIKFLAPSEVVYLSESDVKRWAEQYRREMLTAIPVDWRTDAANNLMQNAKRLNLIAKGVVDPSSATPAKVQAKDVLSWQHKKVIENIDTYFSQRRKIENANSSFISNMGDAVVGFICSLIIFAIAVTLFWYQRRLLDKRR